MSGLVGESNTFTVREFEQKDSEAFRRLNEAWITSLFRLEPKDLEVLLDPQSKIIDAGGLIFMADLAGVTVGCCAMIALGNQQFELAKMAVAEHVRGMGLGRRMLFSVVTMMRMRGARRLILETNSKLVNAIHLYEAAGFRRLDPSEIKPSPYERADVAMELLFSSEA